MTEIIKPNKIRTTRWEDAAKQLERVGIEPGSVARACSRNYGRHRIGFMTVVTVTRRPDTDFHRMYFDAQKVLIEKLPKRLGNKTVTSAYQNGPKTADRANERVGHLADYVAVYTARSQVKGSVEFRIGHHRTVIASVEDEMIPDDAAVLWAHAEGLGHRLSGRIGIDFVTAAVAKIVPWISDYQTAERMVALDAETWLQARPILTDTPKYVRKQIDVVYELLAKQLNDRAVRDVRI
jgi:hypothetical protein